MAHQARTSGETFGSGELLRVGGFAVASGIGASPGIGSHMAALATSAFIVALAEIGDKTQLLSLVLAARFRRPAPIMIGILVATLANHARIAFFDHLGRGVGRRHRTRLGQ